MNIKLTNARIVLGALIATTLIPATAASAQTREIERERREMRDARNDYRDAKQDYRNDRRDARNDTRSDYRNDARNDGRNEWRGNRAPAFRAPFKYQSFRGGSAIQPRYYAPGYRVGNVSRWHLPPASRGTVYVRHYSDLLLVNTRSGRVLRVYNGFYR